MISSEVMRVWRVANERGGASLEIYEKTYTFRDLLLATSNLERSYGYRHRISDYYFEFKVLS